MYAPHTLQRSTIVWSTWPEEKQTRVRHGHKRELKATAERKRGTYVWTHYKKIPGSSEQKMKIKTIDENYPQKKIYDEANSCHTTLQNELTCLKEAFQDHINEVKLKIIKQKWTKDNRKKQKIETRKEITRHLD